jgi:hypothetical protein
MGDKATLESEVIGLLSKHGPQTRAELLDRSELAENAQQVSNLLYRLSNGAAARIFTNAGGKWALKRGAGDKSAPASSAPEIKKPLTVRQVADRIGAETASAADPDIEQLLDQHIARLEAKLKAARAARDALKQAP